MSQLNSSLNLPLNARFTRRAVLGGGLAGAGALLLAACSTGGAATPSAHTGPLKLTKAKLSFSWWGADDRTKKTLAALDLYTKQHPDITFQSSYGGIVGYQDKMVTQLSSGNGADLFQIADRLPLIANNQLLDLDPFIKSGTLDLSGANEKTLSAQKVNGKLYTLPWGLSVGSYFYDTTVFATTGVPLPKNGWSWDEYRATAKAITEASPKGYYGSEDIWAAAGTASYAPFQTFLLSRETQPYTEDGKLNYGKDELKEWLAFWQDMLKSGYVPPAAVTAEENAIQTSPLVKGKAAMYPINSSIASSLQALMKNPLGVVTMPTGKGSSALGGKQFGQYVGGIILGANAHTENVDDVVSVINFLINDPEAVKAQLMSRGAPLTEAATKAVTSLITPVEKSMAAAVAYVQDNAVDKLVAFPTADGQLGTLMQNTHQSVAFGKESVSSAADSFLTQAKSILASAA